MIETNAMKSVSRIICALLCSVLLPLLWACSDDNIQPSFSGEQGLLSEDGIELPPVGTTSYKFMLYSNENWIMMEDLPSWLYVYPTKGNAGSQNITLRVKSYDAQSYRNNKRSFTLRFFSQSDGTLINSFNILQMQPFIHAESTQGSEQTKVFSWGEFGESARFTINVTSNIDWSWEKDNDDFEILKSEEKPVQGQRYCKRYTLSVSPKSYRLNQDQSCHLSLKGEDVKDSEAIDYIGKDWNFLQGNLLFLIGDGENNSPIEITDLDLGSGDYKPVVRLKFSSAIPLKELRYDNKANEWLDFVEPSPNDTCIVFKVKEFNHSNNDRYGLFYIKATWGGVDLSEEIEFYQKPYSFAFDTSTATFTNNDIGTKTFNVVTKGPWKLEYPSSWLNVSVDGAEAVSNGFQYQGNAIISCSATGQNMQLSDLNGELKLTTLDNFSYSKRVTQDKFLFDVTPDQMVSNMPTIKDPNSKGRVNVNCSGGWKIENVDSWINFAVGGVSGKSEGSSSDKYFTIAVNQDNPDFDRDRTNTLKIVSLAHKDKGINVSKDVVVTQLKYMWEIADGTGKTSALHYNPKAYYANVSRADFPLTIKCSGTWTIKDAPDWFKPDKTSGSNNGQGETIYFTPTNNTSSGSRSDTFHITDDHGRSEKTISVTQDGFKFNLVSGQSRIFSDIPAMALRERKTYTIQFEHSADSPYEIKGRPYWIGQSVSHSVTGKIQTTTITLSPQNNYEFSPRNASLTLESTVAPSNSYTFSFEQLEYLFDISKSSITFSGLGKTLGESDTFDLTCSGDWKVKVKPQWLNITPTSGTVGTKISISPATNNLSDKSRERYKLEFVSTQQGTTRSIYVTQELYEFDTSRVELFFDKNGGTRSVEICCKNYNWEIVNNASWISFEESDYKDGGRGTLEIRVQKNSTKSSRTATITVYSKDDPTKTVKKVISVSQSTNQSTK